MDDFAIIWDWLAFAVRWLHVITAIAWIGSSFYFIALDLGLRKSSDLPAGVAGEEWQVHGGGFYHIQKYMVAPPRMPDHLTWFKWESYMTWLTGFALLAIIYYAGADLYLIDPNVLDITPTVAILISLCSIGVGWLIYDFICKSRFGDDNTRLMIFLFLVLVAVAWGYTQVFSGRAAFLHLGVFTATIMSANVFFVIIPNQKIVVADLIAGRTPDPNYGKIAKQRSTHNNYLTLPVLLMMISSHAPIVIGHAWSWLIIAGIVVVGAVVRHFFNTKNAGGSGAAIAWQLPLAALLTVALVWVSSLRFGEHQLAEDESVGAADALAIVQLRCATCHSATPSDESFEEAPGGLMLETADQVRANAARVLAQSVLSDAMPLGNITEMTPEERARLGLWIREGMPD